MKKIFSSMFIISALTASSGVFAADLSYLSAVKDDSGVQKCIRWKAWYPNKIKNNDKALNDISDMVMVTQNVFDVSGVDKNSKAYYDLTYKKIENVRYAMAWCKALPEPQRPNNRQGY